MFGCYSLDIMYDDGNGVEKDLGKAVELYKKACDGGDMLGCTNLGFMYEKGKGVEKDFSKAVELYKKACDGGNMLGCYGLGDMYVGGDGVEKNVKKGIELSKKTYLKLPVYIINIVVNVLACILLIPRYGIFGAAAASALASLSMLVARSIIGEHFYKCSDNYVKLIISMLLLIGTGLVNY